MRRAALLVAAAVAALAACKETPKASLAQCEHVLDRYIDLRLSEDPKARTMTPLDRAHLRGTIANDVLTEPHAQKVKNRCTSDVTAAEYACAVKAPTAQAWNDCFQ